MTIIEVKLSKTEFKNLKEQQIELILHQKQYSLSEEHIKIMEDCEKEADIKYFNIIIYET